MKVIVFSQLMLVLECSRARASYVGGSKPHKLLKAHVLAGVAQNAYERFCVLEHDEYVNNV